MFCRYCGAELRKRSNKCPSCGEDNAPEMIAGKAKKKLTKKQVITIVACILAVAILIPAVYYGVKGIQYLTKENNLYYKDNYSLSEYDMASQKDIVVATIGEHTLTNGQLQVFYWARVYEFVENYGSYSSYYGLDYTKALNEQIYNEETGKTWQHMFLEQALTDWTNYVSLYDDAMANDYVLPADYQELIDGLYTDLEELAAASDLETAEAYLDAYVCPDCTYEEYKYYYELYCYAGAYYNDVMEGLEVTDEELETYFTENEETLEYYEITKDSGKLASVRHILVLVAEDADGVKTYSDAEWEACREKAQKIYDEWLAGDMTEDSFALMAGEYSEDPGSVDYGGLYDGFAEGTMVDPFNDWCFDESRVYGDHDMVQTGYGYHIMYFVNCEEGWTLYSRNGVRSEKMNTYLTDLAEAAAPEINYKKISIVLVQLY